VSCAHGLVAGADRGTDLVPWTVTQSIQQRVAALDETARELLSVAATHGGEMSRSVLIAATGRPLTEMLVSLEGVCRVRLLEEHAGEAYRFTHDVVREVVERGLSAARRLLLHRRVGEALEWQPDELPFEQLAYHFSQGEQWDKALIFLLKAGERARAAFAFADARDLYGRARDVCDRLDGTAMAAALDVVQKRLELHGARGDGSGSAADIAWLLARARRWGDRRIEGLALVMQGNGAVDSSDFTAAERSLRMALALFGGDLMDVRRQALFALCRLLWNAERFSEAEPLFEELAKAPDDDANLLSILAHRANFRGRYHEAVVLLERLQSASGPSLTLAWWHGMFLAGKGEYGRAQTILEEALAIAERTSSDNLQGVFLNTLGWIHGELLDHLQAVQLNGRG